MIFILVPMLRVGMHTEEVARWSEVWIPTETVGTRKNFNRAGRGVAYAA